MPKTGDRGRVDGTACNVATSHPFAPELMAGSNAFCGAGLDHTPVTYTSTPAEDKDRIKEIVGIHKAGSCTQTVCTIRNILSYHINESFHGLNWLCSQRLVRTKELDFNI